MKRLIALLMVLASPVLVLAGDTFSGGYTFTGETGLHTGAQLDDLVERARYAAGAFDATTNALFNGTYFTNDANLRLTFKTNCLTGALLVDGTITDSDIADSTITTNKFTASTISNLTSYSTPYCMGVLSSNQVIASGTWTKIGYDIERIDEGGMFNPSNGIITIPAGKDGDYMFNVGWETSAEPSGGGGALYTNGNFYVNIRELGQLVGRDVHETYGPLSCTGGLQLAVYVIDTDSGGTVAGSDNTNSVYFGAWRLSK